MTRGGARRDVERDTRLSARPPQIRGTQWEGQWQGAEDVAETTSKGDDNSIVLARLGCPESNFFFYGREGDPQARGPILASEWVELLRA